MLRSVVNAEKRLRGSDRDNWHSSRWRNLQQILKKEAGSSPPSTRSPAGSTHDADGQATAIIEPIMHSLKVGGVDQSRARQRPGCSSALCNIGKGETTMARMRQG